MTGSEQIFLLVLPCDKDVIWKTKRPLYRTCIGKKKEHQEREPGHRESRLNLTRINADNKKNNARVVYYIQGWVCIDGWSVKCYKFWVNGRYRRL